MNPSAQFLYSTWRFEVYHKLQSFNSSVADPGGDTLQQLLRSFHVKWIIESTASILRDFYILLFLWSE